MSTSSLISFPQLGADPHPPNEALSYETFFGLKGKPFGLDSDPRFLYRSSSVSIAYENLLGGILRREGLLVLTGEIGTGKTTLCRAVLQDLGRKTFSAFVPDPFASREDLLKMLLIDFGVASIQDFTAGTLRQASRTELSYLLFGFLESLAALDAFVVVVIDEAQNLSLQLIEETRILADAFGRKGHLQIVFVGQPELEVKLKSPDMRQVDQRVSGYQRLAPLRRDEVAGYLQHRLHVAGGSRDRVLFPSDVVDILHARSGGVPRLINRVADRALQLAHRQQAACVDRHILEAALIEIGPATLSPTWTSIMLAADAPGEHAGAPVSASVTPGPSPAAATVASETASPASDEERFFECLDAWLSRDLAPAAGRSRRQVADQLAAPVARPSTPSPSVAKRPPAASGWHDVHGELRGETYMQRLARRWARRVAVAALCGLALNAALAMGSALPWRLSALAAPSPPAPPAAPPLEAAATLESPAPPPLVDVRESVPSGDSGEYVVAVGLFANRERADRLVQELAQAGLHARQRPFQLRRQQLQQVLLGPFATRTDALEALQRLRQLGGYRDASVVGARPTRAAP